MGDVDRYAIKHSLWALKPSSQLIPCCFILHVHLCDRRRAYKSSCMGQGHPTLIHTRTPSIIFEHTHTTIVLFVCHSLFVYMFTIILNTLAVMTPIGFLADRCSSRQITVPLFVPLTVYVVLALSSVFACLLYVPLTFCFSYYVSVFHGFCTPLLFSLTRPSFFTLHFHLTPFTAPCRCRSPHAASLPLALCPLFTAHYTLLHLPVPYMHHTVPHPDQLLFLPIISISTNTLNM